MLLRFQYDFLTVLDYCARILASTMAALKEKQLLDVPKLELSKLVNEKILIYV